MRSSRAWLERRTANPIDIDIDIDIDDLFPKIPVQGKVNVSTVLSSVSPTQ